MGWVIWKLVFEKRQILDSSNEANTVEKGSLDDFLAETGLIPLKIHVCENECGCIALNTRGEVVWMTPTTDMYLLQIPNS